MCCFIWKFVCLVIYASSCSISYPLLSPHVYACFVKLQHVHACIIYMCIFWLQLTMPYIVMGDCYWSVNPTLCNMVGSCSLGSGEASFILQFVIGVAQILIRVNSWVAVVISVRLPGYAWLAFSSFSTLELYSHGKRILKNCVWHFHTDVHQL